MEKKEYWITSSRFKFIVLAMLIMFFAIMVLLFLKADEVTKDPCSICANRFQEPVVCRLPGVTPESRTFYPNYTVVDMRG